MEYLLKVYWDNLADDYLFRYTGAEIAGLLGGSRGGLVTLSRDRNQKQGQLLVITDTKQF